jgi:hypothetical protein
MSFARLLGTTVFALVMYPPHKVHCGGSYPELKARCSVLEATLLGPGPHLALILGSSPCDAPCVRYDTKTPDVGGKHTGLPPTALLMTRIELVITYPISAYMFARVCAL